jgi:uncharacterized protein
MFERKIFNDLKIWSASNTRKPLILLGARQVGKTFVLSQFGAKNFKNVILLDFEEQRGLHEIFSGDLDPQTLLSNISLRTNAKIEPGKDLLIFDEIQSCPNALTSLKYFSEKMPELALCCAGSLLGLELGSASYPVGKVDNFNLFPLNFSEFVIALDSVDLAQCLEQQAEQDKFLIAAHQKLWDLFRLYCVVGGLPEVVALCKQHLLNKPVQINILLSDVRKRQKQLVQNYLADMAKHAGKVNSMHLARVFREVSKQVTQVVDKNVQRFKFKGAVPGISQYSRLASVFDWLTRAGLIIRVPLVQNARTPLSVQVHDSRFKVLPFDVGILGALADLDPSVQYDQNLGTYKGYIAESFVAQELHSQGLHSHVPLYCWSEGEAEIEFLIEDQGVVVPFEVKSGKNTRSQSLKSFNQRYQPVNSFILSAKPCIRSREANSPHMLPLYAVEHWRKMLEHRARSTNS